MTKINVVKSSEKDTIKIKNAVQGNWYRVVKYEHNKKIVGFFGVLAHICGDKYLISPDGDQISHEDLFLEEIQNVEIKIS